MLYDSLKPSVATVGTFDGVHCGHRVVLDELMRISEEMDMTPIVFTFANHPLTLIAPQRAPKRIMSVEEEKSALASTGAEVAVLSFDERLRSMTAREWIADLRDNYRVKILVMGFDNTFGCDGRDMKLDDYRRIGEECGVRIVVAPQLDGVSSSIIRRLAAEGKIREANEALGRPFAIDGTVVAGRQLGRKLGFPTANIRVAPDRLIPANGVYAAKAILPDGTEAIAVVNIGLKPTVCSDCEITVEAHILDWHGDLYGHQIKLLIADRLRGEQRFDNLDQLCAAISNDISTAHEKIFPQA